MASGCAAIFTIPSPLVDGESVAPVRVGQVSHIARDSDRVLWERARAAKVWIFKLPKPVEPRRTGGRVGRIGLHSAVRSPDVLGIAFCELLLRFRVVLEHLFEIRGSAAIISAPLRL